MLFLEEKPLPAASQTLLNNYQDEVDAKPTFPEKVAEGKSLFKARNTKTNPAFKEVRKTLALMSGGLVRCNYCEDSNANQVEHIYPKNFYPEKCFSWPNYCYACGPCNQPKSDKFAIFRSDNGVEIDLKKDIVKNTQPPAGNALLIDPRVEDPTDLLFLDTADTFNFTPFSDDDQEIRRAHYTIGVLGLNSRSHLVRARETAFDNYKARLFEYVTKKENGADSSELNQLADSLQTEHHPTVWAEMKRQRRLHPEIDDLLNRAPEALNWKAGQA